MKKNEIEEILINDYGYIENQIVNLSKEKLLDILKKERDRKKKPTSFLNDFWIIKGLPRPNVITDDKKSGTEKYAWWIFICWISSFVIFALFIFIMIYFFS